MQLLLGLAVVLSCFGTLLLAQQPVPGPNVNMVSGTTLPDGDPYLRRQNEPTLAVSTRNPQHLLAGANDYRTVDVPYPPDDGRVIGDAWLGVFNSINGGMTWKSTLMSGYPQDTGATSPLHAFAVATDPAVRAGTHGMFYYKKSLLPSRQHACYSLEHGHALRSVGRSAVTGMVWPEGQTRQSNS